MADWLVSRFVDVVFILLLLIGMYFMADSAYVFYNSRAAVVAPLKPQEDLTELREAAKDAIGWITLDDTTVDYPVMQGADNYVYLNRDPYGKFSLSGSIFLDSRNARDFSDDYSLIYGHHMSGEFMFGALDDFADAEFFQSHRTGTLITERGKFPLTVLAFYQTEASDSMVFDLEEPREDMAGFIRDNSERYRDDVDVNGRKIIALTTCKSPTSTKRTVVFVLLEDGEGALQEKEHSND